MDAFLTPEKGTLPNDIINGFVKEAVKRGILDNKYNSYAIVKKGELRYYKKDMPIEQS